ncbi:CPBP family intramembrane glutamic endopeptidase [Paraclostridium bifermentans]|uniref:CPBP family intramembrane glutamic endopeptidase n=1 Tax=Paraclostridium bifermentans TaxID=1490 RepID=UPI0018AA87D2|nr:CPBP family intramembrane glutamic endopeptidase [Paraclostridium bifermentans]
MYMKNESLMNKASRAKKLPSIAWAIVLTFLIMDLGLSLGKIPFEIISFSSFANTSIQNENLITLLLELLSFFGISLLVYIRVVKIEGRPFSSIGFCKEGWIKKYLTGFIVGAVLTISEVALLYSFGLISVNHSPSQPIGLSSIKYVIIILIGWIVQSSAEEIVTRGWLMNVLSAKYNVWVGLIVSSIYFGFMHGLNPNISYIAIINLVLAGFLFGLYVLKTNDLWGACGLHCAWNFFMGNVFGFEVSGTSASVGTLFDLNLIGNPSLSGGKFGPEGGICETIIIIAAIIVIIYLDKKNFFKQSA